MLWPRCAARDTLPYPYEYGLGSADPIVDAAAIS
jgi:hypothetical protein